jgi:ATP-dependent Zn protease
MNESAPDVTRIKGIAYHEAGHAVLERVFGTTIVKVAILPVGEVTGGVTATRNKDSIALERLGVFHEGTIERDRYICHEIMAAQAGEAAQELFCPESVEPYHARSDRLQIRAYIKQWNRNYAYAGEREAKVEELYQFTRQLLMTPLCIAAVHALADALIEHKELSGDQANTTILDAIIAEARRLKLSGKEAPRIECPHCADYANPEW